MSLYKLWATPIAFLNAPYDLIMQTRDAVNALPLNPTPARRNLLSEHEEFLPIRDFAIDEVTKFANEQGWVGRRAQLRKSGINCLMPGEFTSIHEHTDTHLAAVFYFDRLNYSEIVFADPRAGFRMPDRELEWLPNFIRKEDTTGRNRNCLIHQPQCGELIIFPGYLQHYVNVNTQSKPRRSMFMDFVFV